MFSARAAELDGDDVGDAGERHLSAARAAHRLRAMTVEDLQPISAARVLLLERQVDDVQLNALLGVRRAYRDVTVDVVGVVRGVVRCLDVAELTENLQLAAADVVYFRFCAHDTCVHEYVQTSESLDTDIIQLIERCQSVQYSCCIFLT